MIYMYGCLQPRELWFIDLLIYENSGKGRYKSSINADKDAPRCVGAEEYSYMHRTLKKLMME